MTDTLTQMKHNHEKLQAEMTKLMAAYHPGNVAAWYSDNSVAASEADVEQSEIDVEDSEADVEDSEADVEAAEYDRGLGDSKANAVREAEQSRGLASSHLRPAPFSRPAPGRSASRADAAVTAMDAALRATRASLVHSVALIDQSLAAADTAVRQAMAGMAFQPGGSTWRD